MFHCLVDLFHFVKVRSHVEFHPGSEQTVKKMQGIDDQWKHVQIVLAVSVTVLEDLEQLLFFAKRINLHLSAVINYPIHSPKVLCSFPLWLGASKVVDKDFPCDLVIKVAPEGNH